MQRKERQEAKSPIARNLNRYFKEYDVTVRSFCDACRRVGIPLSEQTVSKVRSGAINPTHEIYLAVKFFTPWPIDKLLEEELKNRGVLSGK